MSILTKEERERARSICEEYPGYNSATSEQMLRALDTIDALERIINDIARATSMHQVETIIIAARAFGVIEEQP